MEMPVGVCPTAGTPVASRVGDWSGAIIEVRDGTCVSAGVWVGETNKGSPGEAGESGTVEWQAARKSAKQAARPHIQFEKRYLKSI
jgi:hypothetical protein